MSYWVPERTYNLLKLKPFSDMEGVIMGYTPGKGKLYGMIGALIIKLDNGKEFLLSGLTEDERKSDQFPIGKRITFKYRELTNEGLPREARYYRGVD
jgi:DNA ligase-1